MVELIAKACRVGAEEEAILPPLQSAERSSGLYEASRQRILTYLPPPPPQDPDTASIPALCVPYREPADGTAPYSGQTVVFFHSRETGLADADTIQYVRLLSLAFRATVVAPEWYPFAPRRRRLESLEAFVSHFRGLLTEKMGLVPSQLIIAGVGLGGTLAVTLATDGWYQEAVAGLFLDGLVARLADAAPAYLADTAKYNWLAPYANKMFQGDLNVMGSVNRPKVPLFQVHGGADEIAPLESARAFFSAATSPLKVWRVFPYGGHGQAIRELECTPRFLADLMVWGEQLRQLRAPVRLSPPTLPYHFPPRLLLPSSDDTDGFAGPFARGEAEVTFDRREVILDTSNPPAPSSFFHGLVRFSPKDFKKAYKDVKKWTSHRVPCPITANDFMPLDLASLGCAIDRFRTEMIKPGTPIAGSRSPSQSPSPSPPSPNNGSSPPIGPLTTITTPPPPGSSSNNQQQRPTVEKKPRPGPRLPHVHSMISTDVGSPRESPRFGAGSDRSGMLSPDDKKNGGVQRDVSEGLNGRGLRRGVRVVTEPVHGNAMREDSEIDGGGDGFDSHWEELVFEVGMEMKATGRDILDVVRKKT
ncbi:unnamed protein product [Vitrella brassicaformis CCMP3155]|uniref:Peptidase S9 prolyl oligopeptidase catalytic domain-containing protein n=1 Tax=Vitrella brassicaformis (strain CCMP3155) TaxID=1169540 RepID=A0A0G4EEW8_VITBC|nr:unnamed protein product [Vitrella brassicaformis CCMP3155]|eukprot:CEL94243.1 unnamed protein product [Vitrella brassicaformis CCMP3155]